MSILVGIFLVFILLGAIAHAAKPLLSNWGSTEKEKRRALPGDELIQPEWGYSTRAITIKAAPACVWRWLQQMGQGRGGFYSYTSLENLFGLRIRNAQRIHPEWQQLEVGNMVKLHPGGGMVVWDKQPAEYLHLAGTPETMRGKPIQQAPNSSWLFFLQSEDANTTRLLVRSGSFCGRSPILRFFVKDILMVVTFIMERKMLLTIRRRAEAEQCHPQKALLY